VIFRRLAACALSACSLSMAALPLTAMPWNEAQAATFCDRANALTAAEQDTLLRFAAVVREALAEPGGSAALVSRSGLDLSRFNIRYSHAALGWRGESGAWTTRQLYYSCDESRPRIFDQGVAGFVMGTDDPKLGYISVLRLPAEAANAVRLASLDGQIALGLLAATYSANAYAFSLQYQNCNQWVAELLAAAWGNLANGSDVRGRAQAWLRDAGYAPQGVEVNSPLLMLASYFVPHVHLDDHPAQDRYDMKLKVSLPSTLEEFVQQRYPASERTEICHNARQIVVHKGWTPAAAGCEAGPGDRVIALD
jgi:hypothetical protein